MSELAQPAAAQPDPNYHPAVPPAQLPGRDLLQLEPLPDDAARPADIDQPPRQPGACLLYTYDPAHEPPR